MVFLGSDIFLVVSRFWGDILGDLNGCILYVVIEFVLRAILGFTGVVAKE